jgi:hypothetical protein
MSTKGGRKIEYRIQNSEYRTQNKESIKIKTITKSTPPETEKYSLIDYLIWACWPEDLPCWAICVYLLINRGYFNIFSGKSQQKSTTDEHGLTRFFPDLLFVIPAQAGIHLPFLLEPQ